MTKRLLPFILSLLVICSCSLFEFEDSSSALDEMVEISKTKKRIAVLKFLNRSLATDDEMSDYATKLIRERITANEDYVLVEESELEGHNEFRSDFQTYNEGKILKSARAYGLDGVVLGSVNEVVNRVYGDEVGLFQTKYFVADAKLTVRVLNIGTKKQILKRDIAGNVKEERTKLFSRELASNKDFDELRSKSAITKAIEKLWEEIPNTFAQLAWSGSIAKVDPPKYYINTGRPAGIQIGNFLKVFSPNKTVVEEGSGEVMGMATGLYKGTLRVTDYFGDNGAVAILLSGKDLKAGDRVVLYSP